eukprot:TRINITY_DN1140_c0_g1_i3.p1 TRINITY_DN1140_c0_g1~~TRINITY_DN1140_c0_g1_i3.p1  ORF type:complete len:401 (+),score=70.14 TRINITY_DN1140_c0_g1_i3:52-1254(+)
MRLPLLAWGQGHGKGDSSRANGSAMPELLVTEEVAKDEFDSGGSGSAGDQLEASGGSAHSPPESPKSAPGAAGDNLWKGHGLRARRHITVLFPCELIGTIDFVDVVGDGVIVQRVRCQAPFRVRPLGAGVQAAPSEQAESPCSSEGSSGFRPVNVDDSPNCDTLMVNPLVFTGRRTSVMSRTDLQEDYPLSSLVKPKARCTKINDHPVRFVADIRLQIESVGEAGVVSLEFVNPSPSLFDLMGARGPRLSVDWRSRIQWLQGLWVERKGTLLYQIADNKLELLQNTTGVKVASSPQEVVIRGETIGFGALVLTLGESTEEQLCWRGETGQVVWRRPRDTDSAMQAHRREKKRQRRASARPGTPPKQEEQRRSRLSRLIAAVSCCSDANDVAHGDGKRSKR